MKLTFIIYTIKISLALSGYQNYPKQSEQFQWNSACTPFCLNGVCLRVLWFYMVVAKGIWVLANVKLCNWRALLEMIKPNIYTSGKTTIAMVCLERFYLTHGTGSYCFLNLPLCCFSVVSMLHWRLYYHRSGSSDIPLNAVPSL